MSGGIGSFFGTTTAVIMGGGRAIAQIIPDVTIEETYEDGLAITMHPVEKGANVSDHAYLKPKTIEMRVGWSDSGKGEGTSSAQYKALLALQARREPFTVSTGKRLYQNMLVAGISVTTDQRTEHAVLASVRLQEVRIVSAQSTSAGAGDQAMPQKTAATVSLGTIQHGTVNWTPVGGQSTLALTGPDPNVSLPSDVGLARPAGPLLAGNVPTSWGPTGSTGTMAYSAPAQWSR